MIPISNDEFRLIIDSVDIPICAGKENMPLSFLNNACKRLFAENGKISERIEINQLESELHIGRQSFNGHYYSLSSSMTESGLKVCAVHDITELREAKEKALIEMRYRTAQINNAIVAYEADITKNLLIDSETSKNFTEKMTNGGKSFSEFIDRWAEIAIHPNDRIKFRKAMSVETMTDNFKAGNFEYAAEYRRSINNDYHWVRTFVHLIEEPASKDICAFIYVKDIDREKNQELEYRRKAERDQLTGLYNRGRALEIAESRLSSDKEQRFALFMIDVDNFKAANDTYGHTCGDEILCQIGKQLKSAFRSDDVAARVGGDEFVVFCNGNMTDRLIEKKAQTICDCFARIKSPNGESCFSGSVGVCVSDEKVDFNTLYKNADSAMYRAKTGGKNRWCINYL